MIVTGAPWPARAQAIALAARASRQRLFATAGVHPHHAARAQPRTRLASSPSSRAHPRSGRGRRMRPRLFPRLLPARRAAAGLPPPARARRASRQAPVPAPARCTRGLRRHPARARARHWRGVAHCFTGDARGARVLPRTRARHRHHRLDLRRAPRRASGAAHARTSRPSGCCSRPTARTCCRGTCSPKPASRRNEPAYLAAHRGGGGARARGVARRRSRARSTAAARDGCFGLPGARQSSLSI